MVDDGLIAQMVSVALAEDIGTGDVTAEIIPADARSDAILLTRDDGILCGGRWMEKTFRTLDPRTLFDWQHADGETVRAGETLCHISGTIRALLTGERVALNFLQTLSGTATRTRRYIDAVRHTTTKILDTRKTLPGWRLAQKYAVRQGGGDNHRLGLFDAVLIKENHIAAAGSITEAVRRGRATHPQLPLEVEIERIDQIREALVARADRILLDNFAITDIQRAVTAVRGRCPLEASGGINLDNVAAIAETGIAFISIGDLTKNIVALDLSLRLAIR